jgi:hypothetical protein
LGKSFASRTGLPLHHEITSGLCFENGPLRFSPDFQLLGPLFVSDVKALFAENKKTEASVSFAAAHLMKLTSFFELCSFLIRISSIVSFCIPKSLTTFFSAK